MAAPNRDGLEGGFQSEMDEGRESTITFEQWADTGSEEGGLDTGEAFEDVQTEDLECYTYMGGSGCQGPQAVRPDCAEKDLEENGEVEEPDGPYSYEGGQCSAVPPVTLWPIVLVVMVWFRRLQVLIVLLALIPVERAAALDVQRLQTMDGGQWVALREADLGPTWDLKTAFGAHVASAPLVRRYADRKEVEISSVATMEVGVSINLWNVQVGFALPRHTARYAEGFSDNGLGDGVAWVGSQFLNKNGHHLALTTRIEGLSKMHHLSGPSFMITGSYEYDGKGWGLAGNIGYRLQDEEEIPLDHWGRRLEYGAGLRWTPRERYSVKAEVIGSVPTYSYAERGQFPVEVLASGSYGLAERVRLHAGGGVGVGKGIGAPTWRLFSMLEWRPDLTRDKDKDGIVDVLDFCPSRPEDMDGFRDRNGCPDLDNDKDLIVDVKDDCPMEPETYNDFKDKDGCPDQMGMIFVQVMAQEEGSFDGATLTVGDTELKVIEGEVTRHQVYGSGIHITARAEGHYPAARLARFEEGSNRVNVVLRLGLRAPEPPPILEDPPAVSLDERKIRLDPPVDFELDSADLGPEDTPTLDRLAAYLLAHPEILLVRVEGFADEFGGSAYNYDLSIRRAKAVLAYLVYKGVQAERLQALGTGEALRFDREKAVRRVEFTVLIWKDLDGTSAPKILLGQNKVD